MFQDFKQFAMRGNVVDLAVGFTVGVAFTTVARSLVDDIIMPFVGLIVGGVEFEDLYWLLEPGPEAPPPYTTLADAQAAGAITVNYGVFINNIIVLLIVALAMFLLVRSLMHLERRMEAEWGVEKKPEEPTTKKCPYCISTIPRQASRCPECTSQLEPVPAPAAQQALG